MIRMTVQMYVYNLIQLSKTESDEKNLNIIRVLIRVAYTNTTQNTKTWKDEQLIFNNIREFIRYLQVWCR